MDPQPTGDAAPNPDPAAKPTSPNEQVTAGGTVEGAETTPEKALSKNAQKRLLKMEKRQAEKADWKAKKKEKKKEKAAKRRLEVEEWEKSVEAGTQDEAKRPKINPSNKIPKPPRRKLPDDAPRCVFDCDFNDQMHDKEISSLSQQIMYSYATNLRAPTQFHMIITGLTGRLKARVDNISGVENWQATFDSRPYIDMFPREDLVYLTGDSPNTISSFDPAKVYIIGGIVDRNRHKNITYNKAIEQGIATAKLPLDDYMMLSQGTKILTVNHVFEIMTKIAAAPGQWSEVLQEVLPGRKGVSTKEGDPPVIHTPVYLDPPSDADSEGELPNSS